MAVKLYTPCETDTCPNPQCRSTDYGPFDVGWPGGPVGSSPFQHEEIVHVCCGCGYVCPCGWDDERTVEQIIADINRWAAEDQQIREALRALNPANPAKEN